jgi:hypothetical protein
MAGPVDRNGFHIPMTAVTGEPGLEVQEPERDAALPGQVSA